MWWRFISSVGTQTCAGVLTAWQHLFSRNFVWTHSATNRLDPYRYLTWLLKTANNASLTDFETVEKLLPWNAAAECNVK